MMSCHLCIVLVSGLCLYGCHARMDEPSRFIGRSYNDLLRAYPHGAEIISAGCILYSPGNRPEVTFLISPRDQRVFSVQHNYQNAEIATTRPATKGERNRVRS